MEKFNIGDTVSTPNGEGIIICIEWNCISVKHDKKVLGMHNCSGLCEYGYGWNYNSCDLVIKSLSQNILILLI